MQHETVALKELVNSPFRDLFATARQRKSDCLRAKVVG